MSRASLESTEAQKNIDPGHDRRCFRFIAMANHALVLRHLPQGVQRPLDEPVGLLSERLCGQPGHRPRRAHREGSLVQELLVPRHQEIIILLLVFDPVLEPTDVSRSMASISRSTPRPTSSSGIRNNRKQRTCSRFSLAARSR